MSSSFYDTLKTLVCFIRTTKYFRNTALIFWHRTQNIKFGRYYFSFTSDIVILMRLNKLHWKDERHILCLMKTKNICDLLYFHWKKMVCSKQYFINVLKYFKVIEPYYVTVVHSCFSIEIMIFLFLSYYTPKIKNAPVNVLCRNIVILPQHFLNSSYKNKYWANQTKFSFSNAPCTTTLIVVGK